MPFSLPLQSRDTSRRGKESCQIFLQRSPLTIQKQSSARPHERDAQRTIKTESRAKSPGSSLGLHLSKHLLTPFDASFRFLLGLNLAGFLRPGEHVSAQGLGPGMMWGACSCFLSFSSASHLEADFQERGLTGEQKLPDPDEELCKNSNFHLCPSKLDTKMHNKGDDVGGISNGGATQEHVLQALSERNVRGSFAEPPAVT